MILQRWSDPTASYAARVARIETGVGPDAVRLDSRAGSRTVFDDADADTLIGRDQILDWFFAELGRDTILSPFRPRLRR